MKPRELSGKKVIALKFLGVPGNESDDFKIFGKSSGNSRSRYAET
jgi:hypothetical protein